MHVGMVSGLAGPAGQHEHVRELSLGLAAAGHRVTVLTRRDSPDSPGTVELGRFGSAGVARVCRLAAGPPAPLPPDRLLAQVPRLADALERAWRDERPDVVHAHSWMSGLAAVAAARGAHVPVLLTFHGFGRGAAEPAPSARASAEQVIARRAARVVATCEDELFELLRMGTPRSSVTIVPTGVDIERFSPHGPSAPRGCRPRLVTVGGPAPQDGVADVIAALAGIPTAELLVLDGPQADDDPRLRKLAVEAGVADRVRFLGDVAGEDLPALLRSADVVVCAPWYEPLGRAALEAMACGRAVVATDVGGLRDAVVDRVTGLHVPPRDPARLAHALRGLLADRAMPMAYGIAGCDRVASRYSWPRIVAAHEAVHRAVLDRRRPAGTRECGSRPWP